MGSPPKPPEALQVQVNWDEAAALPTMAANAFLVAQTPYEFIITAGFITPPIFAVQPTPEQLAKIKSVTAKPIVRLALSPGRVVELVQALQQQLAVYQQTQKH
jgi:hypothetical protein